jgi:hypothetical protein
MRINGVATQPISINPVTGSDIGLCARSRQPPRPLSEQAKFLMRMRGGDNLAWISGGVVNAASAGHESGGALI